jgi:hypothetical protein
LEENDLKEYVEGEVVGLTNPHELTSHNKKEVKAKCVLLESVRDLLIPQINVKTSSREMYVSLVGLLLGMCYILCMCVSRHVRFDRCV